MDTNEQAARSIITVARRNAIPTSLTQSIIASVANLGTEVPLNTPGRNAVANAVGFACMAGADPAVVAAHVARLY